jgi:hypothetical protein
MSGDGRECKKRGLPSRGADTRWVPLADRGARIVFGFLLLLSTAGCASMPLFGSKTANFEHADAKNPAVEILALWQAAEGPGPKGVPIRGFSGQIYFFTQAKQFPVAVDGSVRVYLFDDHGSLKEQAEPIAVFDFDAAHWRTGARNSALGPGYSVFVPYPRNDYHQTTCSLRIRFTPTAGPRIYSSPASVVLSGPSAKAEKCDEPNIQPPARVTQHRGQSPLGANPTLTTSVTLPASPAPFSSNVRPVSGTGDDARMSLADDLAASGDLQADDNSAQPTAGRSGRLRLQSAPPDSTDRDDN